jgi:hypothetical protein
MKIETGIIAIGLVLAQGPVSQEAQQLKLSLINTYCNHYKDLELADAGDFNPPEVYEKIQLTCDRLRNT